MPLSTFLLITLAAILALGFVFFKYFTGNRNRGTSTYFLAGLRFISVFVLLLLLINPGINQRELEIVKPQLIVAVDQSASIAYAQKEDSVRNYLSLLQNNTSLQEKFSVQTFGFGKEVQSLGQEIDFTSPQTNISRALKDLEKLSGNTPAALVLITDGNQTLGENYQYYRSGENLTVYPVLVGDTIPQIDLQLATLNVNKYAFLNNNFPVEAIVNYSGIEPVETRFEIREGSQVLFSKTLNLNAENNSEVINTTLLASRLGPILYRAEVVPVPLEKNIVNNSRSFGVEVIDERTSVLLLSSVAHPDLGMLKKAIEQNEQREVDIQYISENDNVNIDDYQLVILYQPNNRFKTIYEKIEAGNSNFLVITGTQTDWNFMNSVQENFSKQRSTQTQEIFALYNTNFSQFQFDDIGFEEFPPLEDIFGEITFLNESFRPLLFQCLEGIETRLPLLATLEEGTTKQAVLFGENIWKWRTQSFIDTGAFEEFDTFIGKLVQFLASTQRRERLTFDVESIYLENENVIINAQFFDQNYQFNPQGQLEVDIVNRETKEIVEAGMMPVGNRYTLTLENLPAGEYDFKINEKTSGLTRQGSFVVLEYNVEQQFISANFTTMQGLADTNFAPLTFLDNPNELLDQLLRENTYVSVQKSREKTLPLIDWKILLVLLIISLGSEWFARKYFGLI